MLIFEHTLSSFLVIRSFLGSVANVRLDLLTLTEKETVEWYRITITHCNVIAESLSGGEKCR